MNEQQWRHYICSNTLFEYWHMMLLLGIQTQRRLPAGININIVKETPCDAEYTAFF